MFSGYTAYDIASITDSLIGIFRVVNKKMHFAMLYMFSLCNTDVNK